MAVHESLAAFIEDRRLLPPGARVVVGVSGGPDSVCLLHSLHSLGYRVVAAHLDHSLRRGSWRDAEFVLRLASSLGIASVVERLSKSDLPMRGFTLEEGARVLRYGFLARVASERRAAFVAVGHTADDQVETILMHFLRGAGPHGLRGMLPATPMDDVLGGPQGVGLTLVRPLLTLDRAATEEYCRQLGIRPRRDPTNETSAFFRNRLRHRLLPELERYNPRIREALLRLGEVMQVDVAHLENQVRLQIPKTIVARSPGVWAILREPFLMQPQAIQAELLRQAAHLARPEARDFGYEAVRRALRWMGGAQTGKRLAMPGGRELVDEGDEVLIRQTGAPVSYPDHPQLTSIQVRRLRLPFRLELEEGWSMVGRMRRKTGTRAERQGTAEVWFDAGRVEGELTVHPPFAGARVLLSAREEGKVSDLMINRHIPRGARAHWPVVSDEAGILWIAGLRRAARAPVGRTTRKVLVLRLVRPDKERRR
ncbi:MAG TPA: tRNA lysidine(34) synthetase TilS [Anaerolineales bacterium]|nr:tRNA lysidine(34) synthetase TilS [Anaerolineales bacterium]